MSFSRKESLEPTYEGLKAGFVLVLGPVGSCLEPTYEGLKGGAPTRPQAQRRGGLEPTYEGLKD